MSVSAGLGGGKGSTKQNTTQTTESPAAKALTDLALGFASETVGPRSGLIDAMQEVLSTGGSTIPIISRSVEKSREESGKALSDTEASLAQQGLSGTPFGEMILGTLRQQGAQAAGQTENALAQAIFNMIPNFILGQGQTATSGLAGAIPGMTSTTGSSRGYETVTAGGKKLGAPASKEGK